MKWGKLITILVDGMLISMFVADIVITMRPDSEDLPVGVTERVMTEMSD